MDNPWTRAMLEQEIGTLKATVKEQARLVGELVSTIQKLNDLEMNMSMYFNFYKKAVTSGDGNEMSKRSRMYHEDGREHQVTCEAILAKQKENTND